MEHYVHIVYCTPPADLEVEVVCLDLWLREVEDGVGGPVSIHKARGWGRGRWPPLCPAFGETCCIFILSKQKTIQKQGLMGAWEHYKIALGTLLPLHCSKVTVNYFGSTF